MNKISMKFYDLLKYLGLNPNKRDKKFLTATEAFQASLSKKRTTRAQYLASMIRTVEKEIESDVKDMVPSRCIVKEYNSPRDRELLSEVADHFAKLEYDVTLLSGEKYPVTNLLIINYQNRALFSEDMDSIDNNVD